MKNNLKNNMRNNATTLLLVVATLLLSRAPEDLPWWFFTIPIMLLGAVLSRWKWGVPGFGVGFAAGFLVWLGAHLYFDLTGNGLVMEKLGQLFTVGKVIVLVASGLIGGLLTGLALYTGNSLTGGNRGPELKKLTNQL